MRVKEGGRGSYITYCYFYFVNLDFYSISFGKIVKPNEINLLQKSNQKKSLKLIFIKIKRKLFKDQKINFANLTVI